MMTSLGLLPVEAAGRVDIAEALDVLCERLGLEKRHVLSVRIDPTDLEVDVWLGRDGLDSDNPARHRPDGPAQIEAATLCYPVWT